MGGFLFLAPDDLVGLQEYWKQLRRFELHPALANPPILRAKGGAYGLDRWTNVSPHLKTFSRGLPSASDSATHHGGQPLAWLWLTSANLSGGALGCNGFMRNFEAGVLFHSGPDAVYHTWPPTATTIITTPSPLPPGWPATARSIPLPLPYRLDAPHYTPQDDPWDPTPDLLIPPFFHSLHDLPNLARLQGLRPQIEAIFVQVQEDLKELAARHGLDARGRPLRPLPQVVSMPVSAPLAALPQPLASSDGNAARGREEGVVGEGGGSEPKRLKAAATAAAVAAGECAGGTRAM